MSLEQSMQEAIATLSQLSELKAEVISLTETRDSLRGINERAEEAYQKWLKTVEKTNALQTQVDAEIADKRLVACEAAEQLIANAELFAKAKQEEIVAGYSQKIAEHTVTLDRLVSSIDAMKEKADELNDEAAQAEARLETATAALALLKKTVASL